MATSDYSPAANVLIKFNEQQFDNFIIPAFTLSARELVIIHLPNTPQARNMNEELANLFTRKNNSNNTEVIVPLKRVAHFRDGLIRRTFFPTTVSSYIRKYGNSANPVYQEIYDLLKPDTRIRDLENKYIRQLALSTALSWTKNIVIDLTGLGPTAAVETYELVKTNVSAGGAAILIDYSDEFKVSCTTYIKARQRENMNI